MGKYDDFILDCLTYSDATNRLSIDRDKLLKKETVLEVKNFSEGDIIKVALESKDKPKEFIKIGSMSFIDTREIFGKFLQQGLVKDTFLLYLRNIDIVKVSNLLGKNNEFYNKDYYNYLLDKLSKGISKDLNKEEKYNYVIKRVGGTNCYKTGIKKLLNKEIEMRSYGKFYDKNVRINLFKEIGKISIVSSGFTGNMFIYDLQYKLNKIKKGSARFK